MGADENQNQPAFEFCGGNSTQISITFSLMVEDGLEDHRSNVVISGARVSHIGRAVVEIHRIKFFHLFSVGFQLVNSRMSIVAYVKKKGKRERDHTGLHLTVGNICWLRCALHHIFELLLTGRCSRCIDSASRTCRWFHQYMSISSIEKVFCHSNETFLPQFRQQREALVSARSTEAGILLEPGREHHIEVEYFC